MNPERSRRRKREVAARSVSFALFGSEHFTDRLDRHVLPVPAEVVDAHEGSRLHMIDVEAAIQMIDLMLQDAGIPALSLHAPRLAAFIQVFDGHLPRTFHQGAETGQTEAAFKEIHALFGLLDNARIDQ